MASADKRTSELHTSSGANVVNVADGPPISFAWALACQPGGCPVLDTVASDPEPGSIAWTEALAPVVGLSVNGVSVAGGLDGLESLHVAPGRYVVEVTQQDHQSVTTAVQLDAGAVADHRRELVE